MSKFLINDREPRSIGFKYLDDKDIVHALGYVAIESAYLEDAFSKLARDTQKLFPSVNWPDNIASWRLKPIAERLQKEVIKLFQTSKKHYYKKQDKNTAIRIFKEVIAATKRRDTMLHSPVFRDKNGNIIQVNTENRQGKALTSHEIYGLVELLSILNQEIYMLWFVISRLHDYTP